MVLGSVKVHCSSVFNTINIYGLHAYIYVIPTFSSSRKAERKLPQFYRKISCASNMCNLVPRV
jgi:hypothetical protein